MSKKIISKKWQIIHVIISIVLSAFAMTLNQYEDGSYEEGLIALFCMAIAYWLILAIVFVIIKSMRIKILTKGWVRLHIIISILGGGIFCLLYSILTLTWDFNEDIWIVSIFWPIFYWIWMLINSGVLIYSKNLVSKIWLKRHYFIAWLISIIHMIYRHNEMMADIYGVAFFGASTFLIYYIFLFSTIWILNGFKENESINE